MRKSRKKLKAENEALRLKCIELNDAIYMLIEKPTSEETLTFRLTYKLGLRIEEEAFKGDGDNVKFKGIYNTK